MQQDISDMRMGTHQGILRVRDGWVRAEKRKRYLANRKNRAEMNHQMSKSGGAGMKGGNGKH